MYRQLTDQELKIVSYEYRRDVPWPVYAKLALDLYGPRVERIEIVVESVYNDEYDELRVTQADGFDAAGAGMPADLSTPWWQARLARAQQDYWYRDADQEQKVAWIVADALRELPIPDDHRISYPVRHAPIRTFPAVYVPVG